MHWNSLAYKLERVNLPQKVNVGFAPGLIFVSKAGTYPSGATSGTPIQGMLIFGGKPEGVYRAESAPLM